MEETKIETKETEQKTTELETKEMKNKKLADKIQVLREQGLNLKEIAGELNTTVAKVSYLIRTQDLPKKKKNKDERTTITTHKKGKWAKQEYTKVLIQQFNGRELIEPNSHYSKFIMLYNTSPIEVYQMFKKFLKSEGLV